MHEADIPSSTQWNAGVQMTLPWASTIDVSYVGQHGFNQLREIRGPDPGRHQCRGHQRGVPAAEPGPHARREQHARRHCVFDRPAAALRGLGQVGFNFPDFHETYHSIQASLNRRFRDGIAFGLAYTLGLAWEGNIGLLQRLDHSADAYAIRADQAEYEGAEQRHGATGATC